MIVSLLAAIALPQSEVTKDLLKAGLADLGAYRMLEDLTGRVGPRLSGSPGAAKAVTWVEKRMRAMGFSNVQQVPCMVPHWVRGEVENGRIVSPKQALNLCALGGSVATPKGGLTAQVVEVKSLDDATKLGDRAKGKIIFFNRPFDTSLPNTFGAYGGANDQRVRGASAAAAVGAVGVLVRSMTLAEDDEPHTGALRYTDGVKKIPAAALGIQTANRLSKALKTNPSLKVSFTLSCQNLPDVPSANVIGEIIGSERPEEVIVMGGHLDSWDLGRGAHDDGAGVTQAMEALRLLKKLNLKPKRTIRVVAFMNEENGGRGAEAYAARVGKSSEIAYAAMESDSGGFMPRGFTVSEAKIETVKGWLAELRTFGVEDFAPGGGGADVGPLAAYGATLFGLRPENQRYFDYHHSRNDTIDKVNARELEFGAMAMARLAWFISEEGLSN
ncbi:MAG: M20/M25/M40 family metallo-hydrolase [Fimbriimonadaceae bacterium]